MHVTALNKQHKNTLSTLNKLQEKYVLKPRDSIDHVLFS